MKMFSVFLLKVFSFFFFLTFTFRPVLHLESILHGVRSQGTFFSHMEIQLAHYCSLKGKSTHIFPLTDLQCSFLFLLS